MKIENANKAVQSSTGEEYVILYRGLAVPQSDVERICLEIKTHGLRKAVGMYCSSTMASPSAIRAQAANLKPNPSTIRENISELPQEHVICGCGDAFSATQYAVSYSRSDEARLGLLVTYSMPLCDLAIDGKDFLYTVFQFWDRKQTHHREIVREILGMIYGSVILTYFDLAAEMNDATNRVGICDLACVDIKVVREHHLNQILIHGRCRTRFLSAFQMQAPVPSHQIISVIPAVELPVPTGRSIDLSVLVS
jgi:hypothetical protein